MKKNQSKEILKQVKGLQRKLNEIVHGIMLVGYEAGYEQAQAEFAEEENK